MAGWCICPDCKKILDKNLLYGHIKTLHRRLASPAECVQPDDDEEVEVVFDSYLNVIVATLLQQARKGPIVEAVHLPDRNPWLSIDWSEWEGHRGSYGPAAAAFNVVSPASRAAAQVLRQRREKTREQLNTHWEQEVRAGRMTSAQAELHLWPPPQDYDFW
jgi:hypothetical protein